MDEIQFVPQTTTELNAEEAEVLEKMVDMLTDLEDVQNVFHNAVYV